MARVLELEHHLLKDNTAVHIARHYINWDGRRQNWVKEKEEIQRYIFATDTTKTTNSKLPWSNKTTLPKLTQIRDNLSANYMAAMFPKRKWLMWEADDKESNSPEKVKAIETYMSWVLDRNQFYSEVSKLVLDYIDYGNAFATVEWTDQTVLTDQKEQVGYVGPAIRRINPLDIVFNPTAPSFETSPKIVRSLVTMGEVHEMLERLSLDDKEREFYKELYDYMLKVRLLAAEHPGNVKTLDAIFNISGFDSFRAYLASNFVEILTFYGDIYDRHTDTFRKNRIIKVVDRHRVLCEYDNPSYFGCAPIYHAGWRIRPDNLWAMGPLDNLVGMQYRIDHLENMKADVFDLIAYPPLKIKGYVEDFEWGPFERIYTGDDGDVELLSPNVQALQADNQIMMLEAKMEEMAGSPKEAMGFRTPGEKTAYEVQRLENAASRIFTNKIAQFERDVTEPLINAMLELARRNLNKATVRTFDPEFKVALFQDTTPEDITGNGRIKPIAARHFAERAQQIQDINAFFGSPVGQDPMVKVHFSGLRTAQLFEHLLEIQDYELVSPYVALAEQKDMQMAQNSQQEQIAMETTTPSGLTPDDHDL